MGIGTSSPSASLHMRRTDGTSQIRVEETNATASARTLLHLKNTGNASILLERTSSGTEAALLISNVVGQFFVQQNVSPFTALLQIDSTGNATVPGTMTTGGTTCGDGCRNRNDVNKVELLSQLLDFGQKRCMIAKPV